MIHKSAINKVDYMCSNQYLCKIALTNFIIYIDYLIGFKMSIQKYFASGVILYQMLLLLKQASQVQV